MNYNSTGYKPRDDWIFRKDVTTSMARFRAVRTVSLPPNTIIKENKAMADYKTFQMKMYGEEDEKLIRLAETANTDKTTFAKRRIFSDEGIIILDKSNYISRSLIEISDQLKGAKRDEKLSDELIDKTYAKLCDVARAFVSISKELTDFKAQHEGGEL